MINEVRDAAVEWAFTIGLRLTTLCGAETVSQFNNSSGIWRG